MSPGADRGDPCQPGHGGDSREPGVDPQEQIRCEREWNPDGKGRQEAVAPVFHERDLVAVGTLVCRPEVVVSSKGARSFLAVGDAWHGLFSTQDATIARSHSSESRVDGATPRSATRTIGRGQTVVSVQPQR